MKRNCKLRDILGSLPFIWMGLCYSSFQMYVLCGVFFLCIVFPVFLDCLVLIGSSVFCKVYLHNMGVFEKKGDFRKEVYAPR